MPLQNKVDPFGTIHANSMRGLFMGNRGGQMHDPPTKMLRGGRPWVTRQWIICLTQFKDRKRTLMSLGSYTELFFLDEVCALAAGHRPCAECRRADYQLYCTAIEPQGPRLKAPDLDRRLHGERLGEREKLTANEANALPDGSFVCIGSTAYARRGPDALHFSFSGYGLARPWQEIAAFSPALLTPRTSVVALANGYRPVWHASAALDARC